MNQKHVVIIADALDFQYAGIKVYLEGLVKALQNGNRQHRYTLLRADEDFRDYAGQVYVKSYVSRFLHPKSRLLVEIPQSIKQLKPDVVVEPCHFGPFRIPGNIKRVTFIHDMTPVTHPQFHMSNSTLLHKLLLPGVVKRANLIVTNSQRTKEDVIKNYAFANGKTEVLYPGLQEINNLTESKIPELTWNHDQYILHVGTIEPRKNLDFLLDIFAEIKKTKPLIKLVISGKKGWKVKSFMKKMNAHPNRKDIFITGYLETGQILALYRHASCLLFTSHYEGFGLPLLEAMQLGCPIITSNNSTQREVCKDAAYYLDSNKAIDWANAYHLLSENHDYRLDLIEKGKIRSKTFNWMRSADKFDRLITTIFEYAQRRPEKK